MTDKARIDIKLLLPNIPDGRDECVKRLTDLLGAKQGIQAVHLSKETEDQICIHFDEKQRSISEIRELARRAGAELERRFGHLILRAAAMHGNRARTVEEALRQLNGVLEASVAPTGMVRIEFDREATDESSLSSAIETLGISRRDKSTNEKSESKQKDHASCDHDHEGILGERAELIFTAVSGACLLIGWLLGFSSTAASYNWWLFIAGYFFGGFFPFKEALANIRAGRFEIDFLMIVAAIGAATLGKWFEGTLLLFLFSLGHSLEHYAMGRAKRAIEALGDLAPKTALVRRDSETREIPVEELAVGDVVIIKPNERIPADGFVIQGESSVNQAPITGESAPVDKRSVEDISKAAARPEQLDSQYRVYAGSINQSGALEVQVSKLSSESTLSKVVQMVSEAETQKAASQLFTDRIQRYFVPAVIVLAIALLFAWVVIDESFSQSFYRSMAVLVAASPCALAISTPSAVLSGVARAARGGVLVKGGAPLERLGMLQALAFDKTGTLTEGKPRLVDVVTAEGINETDLLSVAVAVEALSDHPLAAAVVEGGRERLGSVSVPEAREIQSITGRGVQARVDDQLVHIGKDDLFREVQGSPVPDVLQTKVESLESQGRTTMIVRRGDQFLGVLGMMDTPRATAKAMVARLQALGITKMVMLSGDNQQVANAVAKEVGLTEAWGDLMPEQKVEAIKKLDRAGGVAMIGDGVNDAPAMANATVGIAMGAAGSDVALETADIALMADDLSHLPFAIGLSRKTYGIIRQNLWFSLGMVAFLIPATILGLKMGAAVFFHEGSTVLVVFNALRLLAYQEKA